MTETYETLSKNVLKNLDQINEVLETIKIESKVLTPVFGSKLENLKSTLVKEDDVNHSESVNNSSIQSFNSSENVKQYTRQDVIKAFSQIKSVPKDFGSVKVKKIVSKSYSSNATTIASRGNLMRGGSLQTLSENGSRSNSRSNSLADITAEMAPKPPVKVEALIEKIQENKRMLEGIKSHTLSYPETKKFGENNVKLVSEFQKALAEITEMVNNLEQNVKEIDKEDVDLALDEELNEMLEKFTKTIKDYNFLQQNSTIELATNLNDHELEFPYSSLLDELKSFLDKY